MPQHLGSPIVLTLPSKPTGYRIYEEVWAQAQLILKRSSAHLTRDKLWWQKGKLSEALKSDCFKPFVLKTVDRGGMNCS